MLGAALFLNQRQLVFPIPPVRLHPADVGANEQSAEHFTSFDGVPVEIWRSGEGAGPVVLLLHGNAQVNGWNLDRIELARSLGLRTVAMEYRGYNGNPGQPSEAALVGDARALLAQLAAEGTPAEEIVLWGYSIGAAIAVQIGVDRRFNGILLEAPFLSLRALVADLYPFAPVRWLLRDPFLSDEAAPAIASPTLVVTGEEDAVVPTAHARALAALVPDARLATIPGAGHADLVAARKGREEIELFLRARIHSPAG